MKTNYSLFFRRIFPLLFLLFALAANLFAQPQYYNFNTAVGSNVFPFGVNPATGKSIQTLYLPGAFNQPTPAPSGTITKIYMMAVGASNTTFTQLTIKMGLTTDTDLPTGAWYTTGMTTVFDQSNYNITTVADQFFVITLTTPFSYDNTKSLVVEITQCGYSGSGFGVRNTSLSGTKRHAGPLTAVSCPHPWGNSSAITTHTGIDISTASQNYAMKLPTPGVNTNYVAIPHQSGMIGFGNLTIEAWVKTGGSTTANTVLNKGGVLFDYQLGINATTNNPFFRAQGVITIATTVTITPNVWTHLAVTYDGATVKFYKDGAMAFSMAAVSPPGSSANEMRIGRGNADAGSGNIEELRLWSVARTQGAIDSNRCRKYPSSFSSISGLKALWHLDSNFNDSISSFNGTAQGTVTFDTVTFPIPGVNCNLVGIEHEGNLVPNVYSLEQNYPNPFNPVTNIKFSLPKGGFVELKIYDILGKEVSTLIEDPFEAGTYTVTFDASKLSSGVYFYTFRSGDFTSTKKMLLIK